MKERIVEQRFGNRSYYYYLKSYREKINPLDKGKTRGSGKSKVVIERIYLGKAEDILEKCKRAEEESKPQIIKKFEYGLVVSLYRQAKEINLVETIDKYAKKRNQGLSVGNYILLSAISRVGRALSKRGVDNFVGKTPLREVFSKRQKKIKSQNFYCAFEKLLREEDVKKRKELEGIMSNEKVDLDTLERLIGESEIEKIEEELFYNLQKKYGIHLNIMLYDTTNFFTFIDKYTNCSLPQQGYNKRCRHNRRQIGLALALIKELQIPILHKVYCGHINDVELFPSAIRKLITRCKKLREDLEGLVLVFDKGNNSKKNIREIDKIEGLKFIGSLTPSHHRDLLKIGLDNYRKVYKGEKVYSCYKNVFGMRRKIVITYNERSKKRQEEGFNKRIKEIKKEMRDIFKKHKNKDRVEIEELLNKMLDRKKINTARASYYLGFEINGDGIDKTLKIKPKNYRIRNKRLSFGKTILFTDALEMSNEEIISNYRGRSEIEDVFKLFNSSDGVAVEPFYHYTDSKIVVQAFCLVIALLLVKLLEYRASAEGLTMSTKVLLSELKDITEVIVIYKNNRIHKQICEMSSIQRMLFDLYELDKFP